jgi:repressor LexA
VRILTNRQKEVLAYVRGQVEGNGIPPSTREIQSHFGFASQTAALNHLRALQKKGFIERMPNKARAVRVTGSERAAEFLRVPLLGQIAAGMPSETEQSDADTVRVAPEVLRGHRGQPLFALRVTGDSMIGAHIMEGDIAVFEKRLPESGEIVAALVDGESTLKRFLFENGRTVLRAENPVYPTILPVVELNVQGVMVGLMRSVPTGMN